MRKLDGSKQKKGCSVDKKGRKKKEKKWKMRGSKQERRRGNRIEEGERRRKKKGNFSGVPTVEARRSEY